MGQSLYNLMGVPAALRCDYCNTQPGVENSRDRFILPPVNRRMDRRFNRLSAIVNRAFYLIGYKLVPMALFNLYFLLNWMYFILVHTIITQVHKATTVRRVLITSIISTSVMIQNANNLFFCSAAKIPTPKPCPTHPAVLGWGYSQINFDSWISLQGHFCLCENIR